MSILRRYHRKGNIYFITNVTLDRKPLLVTHADLLLHSFNSISELTPFDLLAWVIMPEHFHIVVDPKDANISSLLQTIKMSFGALYRERSGLDSGRVWQNRFWDHITRDQRDLNRHIDYIHFNPVKHAAANSPFDWQWSSIHDYLNKGPYRRDWGTKEIAWGDTKFGE